ncbi:hypothetical protein FH063_004759 [Azospirillum argentinense]|uniref:Uncharacterized protein n=1 Tax=Azospirillum argentinense TaxID=2970906 RepID=A0A5B0KKQ4_9PROT|nr:hypothetical protein FH063_004759 [Azospirillum argentinense]
MNDTIYVGLDVHKATVAVTVAEGCGAVRCGNWEASATRLSKSPSWRKSWPRVAGG